MSRPAKQATALLIVSILLAFVLLGTFAWNIGAAMAADVPQPVPQEAKAHQRLLTRIAYRHWGLGAPVALFAAQIHQESSWRGDAKSRYADGWAQFTPATADWIVTLYPEALGDQAAPYSAPWAFTAMVLYDKRLFQRVKPWYARDVTECDSWAMALSQYNGGPGWLARDRRLTEASGDDPDKWFGHVEFYSKRADWALKENRGYPRRILLKLEPLYLDAGWPGAGACSC